MDISKEPMNSNSENNIINGDKVSLASSENGRSKDALTTNIKGKEEESKHFQSVMHPKEESRGDKPSKQVSKEPIGDKAPFFEKESNRPYSSPLKKALQQSDIPKVNIEQRDNSIEKNTVVPKKSSTTPNNISFSNKPEESIPLRQHPKDLSPIYKSDIAKETPMVKSFMASDVNIKDISVTPSESKGGLYEGRDVINSSTVLGKDMPTIKPVAKGAFTSPEMPQEIPRNIDKAFSQEMLAGKPLAEEVFVPKSTMGEASEAIFSSNKGIEKRDSIVPNADLPKAYMQKDSVVPNADLPKAYMQKDSVVPNADLPKAYMQKDAASIVSNVAPKNIPKGEYSMSDIAPFSTLSSVSDMGEGGVKPALPTVDKGVVKGGALRSFGKDGSVAAEKLVQPEKSIDQAVARESMPTEYGLGGQKKQEPLKNSNIAEKGISALDLGAGSQQTVGSSMPIAEPVPTLSGAEIKALVTEMVDYISNMNQDGVSTTTVQITHPPIFNGATIVIQEHDTAKGEFNVNFTNLSPEAQSLIENRANQLLLRKSMEEKGCILQMITTSERGTVALGNSQSANTDGRHEQESEQHQGKREKGEDQEQEQE